MPNSPDLLYNAVQLLVDALIVAAVFRFRNGLAALIGLGVAAACALLLAFELALDFFHCLRLLSFATFLHGPLLLGGLACAVRRASLRWSAVFVASGVLIVMAALDAFLIEPSWLDVNHVILETDKVARPVRIVVVADLQTDRIGDYEQRVLTRVMDASPDLVLMSGDYLHEADPVRRRRLRAELRELLQRLDFDAPLGIYATQGNVDPRNWDRIFDGTHVRPLRDTTSLPVGELQLTGLDLEDSFDATLRLPSSERFHVVFGHAPDFALGEVDADLLVAGHTHGGQVRLPILGPIITFSRVPRAWAAGVTRLSNQRTLLVSRGIGMERGRAPRLRFGCRPELVVVDLIPGS